MSYQIRQDWTGEDDPVPTGGRVRLFGRLVGPLVLVLVVAVLVLGVLVWWAAAGSGASRAAVGEQVPLQAAPYGRSVTVELPGSQVLLVAGAPVDRIGHGVLGRTESGSSRDEDLVAPDGGRLVPLSWQIRSTAGFGGNEDTEPIVVRLVAGDQRTELGSTVLTGTSASLDAFDAHDVVVGVAGEVGVEDLTIEVEYDGLVQTVDVASGEVDAGAARALYEPDRDFAAACGDDCTLAAAPSSAWRATFAPLTLSWVTLYPYDAALGWAEEGSAWAGLRLTAYSVDGAEDHAGDHRFVTGADGPLVVRLDGAEPVRTEGLDYEDFTGFRGRVVFEVPADAEPRELLVAQTAVLDGDRAPRTLPVSARIELSAR